DVPEGGMTLKLKEGETNSQPVKLKAGEIKEGIELTGPASTAFPSNEEQLHRILEKMDAKKKAAAQPKPEGGADAHAVTGLPAAPRGGDGDNVAPRATVAEA